MRETYGFLRLASHPSQVRTQVLVLQTCESVWPGLTQTDTNRHQTLSYVNSAISETRPQGPPREKLPTNDLSSGASHAEGPGDEVVPSLPLPEDTEQTGP